MSPKSACILDKGGLGRWKHRVVSLNLSAQDKIEDGGSQVRSTIGLGALFPHLHRGVTSNKFGAEIAHRCSLSLGFGNIWKYRHRHSNINIREIIWLGNQLTGHWTLDQFYALHFLAFSFSVVELLLCTKLMVTTITNRNPLPINREQCSRNQSRKKKTIISGLAKLS